MGGKERGGGGVVMILRINERISGRILMIETVKCQASIVTFVAGFAFFSLCEKILDELNYFKS